MLKSYSCFICDKELSSKQSLIRHLSIEKKETEDIIQIDKIDMVIADLQKRAIKITTTLTCQYCNKAYSNKYNCNVHEKICYKRPDSFKTEIHSQISTTATEATATIKPTSSVNFIKNKQTQLIDKVKILVAEDYMPILIEKLGSKEAAYAYLRTCMYKKQAGDLDIFNKVHLEGRSPAYYPVKCLDRKALRFAYVNRKGCLVEGSEFVAKHISGNVQDCYIQIQNEAIMNHVLKGTPSKNFLFNQHDVLAWQGHLVEYLDSKYQLKLLQGLADMLFEKIEEFQDCFLELDLSHQFDLEELEEAPDDSP